MFWERKTPVDWGRVDPLPHPISFSRVAFMTYKVDKIPGELHDIELAQSEREWTVIEYSCLGDNCKF